MITARVARVSTLTVQGSHDTWAHIRVDKDAITILFGTFFIIAAKLEFSRKCYKAPFGAEIQRQNVLKFEIFPLSSFGETVVQSRSSQN